MRIYKAFTALLIALASTQATTASDWSLVGSWRLTVDCRNFDQINNVNISEATTDRVRGTTNVEDVFGKITAGQFDGKQFVFLNKYKWDGQTYTEEWRGALSRGGDYLKGAFTTNHAAAGGCSFRGSRV